MDVLTLYNYCIIYNAFLSLVLVPAQRLNGLKWVAAVYDTSLLRCKALPLQKYLKSWELIMISVRCSLLRLGNSGYSL